MGETGQEFQKQTTKLRGLSESEKVALICGQQFKLNEFEHRVKKLKCAHEAGLCIHCADKDKTIEELGETIKALRLKLFGRSSERRSPKKNGNGGKKGPKSKERKRLPSERYPDAKIKIETITMSEPPKCVECQDAMVDSGLKDVSERLEIIPMEIFIMQTQRVRYHCPCCQSAPVTAPLPARIAPNTSLNDSVLIEAAIAKFYDLIPTERFAKMLSRSNVQISDKLLFAAQKYLAKAFYSIYLMLKEEVQTSRIVHADESPHRMLERNEGNYLWYLWSFCTKNSVYFEIHSTRAGSVSIEFLKQSQAGVLLTDVYSGYTRTIREVNEYRQPKGLAPLISAHCNDHARRYFYDVQKHALAEKVLDVYEQIYAIEAEVQELIKKPISNEPENSEQALKLRQTTDPLFGQIYDLSSEILLYNSQSSSISTAANYFLKNLKGLTVFLTDLEVPISNAPAERSVRNPAIGRKTWYGTHSRKGAEITAVHFSIFESCRLNNVNPREYCNHMAQLYNQGKSLLTPFSYSKLKQSKPPPVT